MSKASICDSVRYSGSLRDVDWVCGAAMILAADFVRRVGGFDENMFLYGEDEDLCIQAHGLERRVVTAQVCPVVHVFGWGDKGRSRRTERVKYESLLYFVDKNAHGAFSRGMMKLLLPFHVHGWQGGIRRWMKLG